MNLKKGDRVRNNVCRTEFTIHYILDIRAFDIDDNWSYISDCELIKYKSDPIVKSVIKQFKKRSEVGIKKYGTTLKDNNTDDFLQHLKEELMDGILYIQKLQDNERKQ